MRQAKDKKQRFEEQKLNMYTSQGAYQAVPSYL